MKNVLRYVPFELRPFCAGEHLPLQESTCRVESPKQYYDEKTDQQSSLPLTESSNAECK